MSRGFQTQLTRIRIELEQFTVAAPVDSEVHLMTRLFLTESAAKKIEEESFPEVPVGRGLQAVTDCPNEWRACPGLGRENRLGRVDVASHESPTFLGDMQIGFVNDRKAEQLSRIDQRQQVLDVERETLGKHR